MAMCVNGLGWDVCLSQGLLVFFAFPDTVKEEEGLCGAGEGGKDGVTKPL